MPTVLIDPAGDRPMVGDYITISGEYLPLPWWTWMWAWATGREPERQLQVFRVISVMDSQVTYRPVDQSS